jgi:hypothetical protein
MRVSPSETSLAAGFEQSAVVADQTNGGDEQLAGLKQFQSEHPIWNCPIDQSLPGRPAH